MKHMDSGLRAKKAGISLVVILAMLVSGLAITTAPTIVADDYMGGEYGGVLRVALTNVPSSLNPLASTLNGPAKQIIDVMYESLGRTDPYTLNLIPWMASSWSISETDDSMVTVVLKNGITWHDGEPVTLDDIEYTFGPDGYDISYITNMTKDYDSNAITFNLDAPDSRFFSEIMLKKIVPEDFTATSEPMGCGPFMLESTDAESTVVVAFDDHFNARPYIDSMVYTYYPYQVADFSDDYPLSDLATEDPRWDGFYRAAYDLTTGKIDFIGWDLSTNHTTASIEVGGNYTTLILDANSTLVRSNGLKLWYLGFNNAPDHLLNDMALRKAISYGINKNTLTLYDISGGLEKADSVVSKYDIPWYNGSMVPHGYDMSIAKQLLTDAGYMDYDADGYIEKAGPVTPNVDYEEISLTLLGPPQEDVTPYTMSTNIMTWFDMLGLKVTLVSNTTESHNTKIAADDFDMFLATDESGTVDPQFISNMFHSESATNVVNFAGTKTVEKYPLIGSLNNITWTVDLPMMNLMDPVAVYHNGTLVADTEYDLDYENGIFTLDSGFVLDYANDTLNITFDYLPIDSLIEMANKQMDPAMRAKYIKDAQAVLADMEPTVPLFSYRVNHAYNASTFSGWVQTLGGINNYWSFISLKNEILGNLDVTLSSFNNFITAGATMNLFVKVQDLDGASVQGSLMFSGEGTFGTPTYDDTGEQYTVQYTAPTTTVSRTITLDVEVYAAGYVTDSSSLDITLHPEVKTFMVEITRGDTTLASGNETSISVLVLDRSDSSAISGATVVLTLTPVGLGGYLDDVTGTTNAAGEFVTTFGSNNVTIDTTFRITAYVTMEGYVDAEQSTSISVSRDPTIQGETAQDKGFLGLPAPSFMTVLVLLAGMSVVFAVSRRKRN